tara:strand:- start:6180 stop:6830 length:651 start_codon:yes stop_codon:yes gene_type:complete
MGAPTASQKQDRKANTQELMSNIMTGGEISKKREAELQKAANAGRGVQFITAKPNVGNLKQYERDASGNIIRDAKGKPQLKAVKNANVSATDYTGRITANAPTLGEAVGDAGRALFGGQAKDPKYLNEGVSSAPGKKTTDYMQYTPKPQKIEGIVPTIAKKGGVVGAIVSDVFKKPKKEKVTTQSILAKQRQGFKDDPYSVPSLLLGGSKQKLGDS